MTFLNIEIKARINEAAGIGNLLLENNAKFIGIDHQQDTYFNVKRGRLKLREGNIENSLIYYERADLDGPKNSHFQLLKVTDSKQLKDVLEKSIGIKVIVRKKREIYFIGYIFPASFCGSIPDLYCKRYKIIWRQRRWQNQ